MDVAAWGRTDTRGARRRVRVIDAARIFDVKGEVVELDNSNVGAAPPGPNGVQQLQPTERPAGDRRPVLDRLGCTAPSPVRTSVV